MIIEPFLTEMASRGGIISADGDVKGGAIERIIAHAKDSHAAAWSTLEKVTLPPGELTPETYRELEFLANFGLRSAGGSQHYAGKVKDLLIDICKVLTLLADDLSNGEPYPIGNINEVKRILKAVQEQVGEFDLLPLMEARILKVYDELVRKKSAKEDAIPPIKSTPHDNQ